MPPTQPAASPFFDPRTVPVVASPQTRGLPAPAHRLTAAGLRDCFASPRPWTPELVREARFSDRAPAEAAVLLPLVMHPRPTLLLTQRTAHLSSHAGQIALPGGKLDDGDDGPVAAALRETQEEIGLLPDWVEVLGTLPTYITGTAFTVTPVVGLVRPGFELLPNPYEVAEVFEVPLEFLMNPAHHHLHALSWQGVERHWYSMPYHDGVRERFIWGATAGMLRNFYHLLSAA